MNPASLADGDAHRLRRLRALELLDTPPEAALDSFTALASSVTGMPIALICLVDEERIWVKSAVGLPQGLQTTRHHALCSQALDAEGVFEVEDARAHPEFARHPLVCGAPRVAHYAGVALRMPGGERMGTLCLMDPCTGRLPARDHRLLEGLAHSVVQALLQREHEMALRKSEVLDFADVTEKKRLSKALRERNELLESVIAHLPCGLVVYDENLGHVVSNERLRTFLDLPAEFFASEGAGLESLLRFNAQRGEYGPGDPQLQLQERLARARAAQTFDLERTRPDGTVLVMHSERMPSGWKVQIYTDVTESRKATRELRASEQRLALAVESLGLGLWEYEPQDDRLHLTESWSAFFDDEPRPRTVRLDEMMVRMPPQSAAACQQALDALLSGETPMLRLEHEMINARSETIWALSGGVVTERDAEGRPLRVVGTTKDVTRERHAQDALHQALEAANAANRAKADFLATMSHEIRTPINGVIGLARMLEEAQLPARETGYVRMINSCATTLLGLVNDVLDFSKIEAGQMVLEQIDTDLQALVQETADIFRARAHDKGVGFSVQVAADVPQWVRCDSHRLQQILLNLLGNALKFTAEGGFALQVGTAAGEDGARMLRFDVSDTGIGISPEGQQRLFKRFSQADASTTRQFEGTGLGLAIARDLALLMGGDITVSSTLGAGSTFTLLVPLVHTSGRAPAAPVVPERLASQEAPILLVEDNAINQLVARALLNKLGYTSVTVAENGQAAVEACARQRFALVLMDCQMPVMDGFAATRELRARGFDRPIIALTAGAVKQDRDACAAAGMDDYLAKPIDASLLAGTINHWLRVV